MLRFASTRAVAGLKSSHSLAQCPGVARAWAPAPQHQRRSASSTRLAAKPKQLSAADAQELLLIDDYQYVDVRSPNEFAEGHPPGAINIPILISGPLGMLVPNPDFEAAVAEQLPDTGAKLLIGCRSGARSAKALEHFVAKGYSSLAHNSQGWIGWIAAGGMVCKPRPADT